MISLRTQTLLLALTLGFVGSAIIGGIRHAYPHQMAAAEGIPEYVYQSGCCGKGDCFELPLENVSLTENGYEFIAPQPDHPNEKYTVSEDEYGKKLRDSSDGKYWACFYMPGFSCARYDESGGDSHYGRGCLEFSKVKDPWKLRCFFRPVNA